MTKTSLSAALLLLATLLTGCITPTHKDADKAKHRWQDDHGVPNAPSPVRFQ